MVVKSGDQRKKLISNEHVPISDGDIIELIPGHHFFKYVTSSQSQKRVSNDGSTNGELSSKKMRRQVRTGCCKLNLLLVSVCFTKFVFLYTNV